MIQRYAAVGNDGMRPVVWGIGDSPDGAREDAGQWMPREGEGWREAVDSLRCVPISEERFNRIARGDVDAADL
jgi:hypothetical protein